MPGGLRPSVPAMDTIKSKTDIDRLFKEGIRAGRGTVVVLVIPNREPRDPEPGRVVFVAGKKNGGAVHRNRCKRVLREACRRAGGPWAGLQVALIARRSVAFAAPARIDRDLAAALRELGIQG